MEIWALEKPNKKKTIKGILSKGRDEGTRDKAEVNSIIRMSVEILERTWNFPVKEERFGQLHAF